jgi:hypothetical protein
MGSREGVWRRVVRLKMVRWCKVDSMRSDFIGGYSLSDFAAIVRIPYVYNVFFTPALLNHEHAGQLR